MSYGTVLVRMRENRKDMKGELIEFVTVPMNLDGPTPDKERLRAIIMGICIMEDGTVQAHNIRYLQYLGAS